MAVFSQTTFSNTFSWMKNYEFRLEFQRSLFLRAQLMIFQHWFGLWPGADQATSHYLNQWCPRLPTHTCVTRPQWVKSNLRPTNKSSQYNWTGTEKEVFVLFLFCFVLNALGQWRTSKSLRRWKSFLLALPEMVKMATSGSQWRKICWKL